ncbi:MAG: cytochrome c [Bacteriovoracaceae bacterium]|nr:cytochrome c [Bacteroidota bacterium]
MEGLKRVLKWGGIILGSLLLLFVIAVYALQSKSFDAPYPKITASTDSALIARGKHLVYGPAHCNGCHFAKDDMAKALNGEPVELKGGFEFVLPFGVIRTPNLTSDNETGIGGLRDAEIARILRYGVFPDGRAVFDFMPFHNLSDEDLTAVISYLRTLSPVNQKVVRREINFLGKAVVAFLIKPVGPMGEPPSSVSPDSTSAYGKYLVHSIANCVGCHTNRDMMTGAFIGEPFAGGFQMPSDAVPGLMFTTPNITPDPETGKIFPWTEEVFVHRFRQGVQIVGSPMPWGSFKNMTGLELKAIYRYLRSVEPVHKKIDQVVQKIE